MRVVLKAADSVVTEDHQSWAGPKRSPGRAVGVASRRGSVVEDTSHVHQVVWVLIFEGQVGHEPGVNDQRVVLGKLEPKREGGKPAPVFRSELVGNPLMGRPQLGRKVPGETRIPPLEAMLVVITANGPGGEPSCEPNNPERIRPLGDQISHQDQMIVLLPARLREQVLQLLAAAMDVSDDEGTGAHIPILGAGGKDSKFVRPLRR